MYFLDILDSPVKIKMPNPTYLAFLLTLLSCLEIQKFICVRVALNIILVRAEAMHGKTLLLILLSSVPAPDPAKAGVKTFRNMQIANLIVHRTEFNLSFHPPNQTSLIYKPETSLMSIDIVATYPLTETLHEKGINI